MFFLSIRCLLLTLSLDISWSQTLINSCLNLRIRWSLCSSSWTILLLFSSLLSNSYCLFCFSFLSLISKSFTCSMLLCFILLYFTSNFDSLFLSLATSRLKRYTFSLVSWPQFLIRISKSLSLVGIIWMETFYPGPTPDNILLC